MDIGLGLGPDYTWAMAFASWFISIIYWVKNTENTISTNGRYNQAETTLIVDLETQINQSQSYNNGSLTSS